MRYVKNSVHKDFQPTNDFAETIFREKCFRSDFWLDRRKLTFKNCSDNGKTKQSRDQINEVIHYDFK